MVEINYAPTPVVPIDPIQSTQMCTINHGGGSGSGLTLNMALVRVFKNVICAMTAPPIKSNQTAFRRFVPVDSNLKKNPSILNSRFGQRRTASKDF